MNQNSFPLVSGRYSPLRYPGGKGKLARFVASVIEANGLADGRYVEPYAGGAAIAWELLLTGIVRHVSINDVDKGVFSFWKSVLMDTENLVRLIRDTPVNVEARDKLKRSLHQPDVDQLTLGFSVFFLNRTNRSGILNGGMIGGRSQQGPWKLDARYNKQRLIEKIERIASMRRRISVTNMDAIDFLRSSMDSWTSKTLAYLDPPYYIKGRDLYYSFYDRSDHAAVAECIQSFDRMSWIVSYDDVPQIKKLYKGVSRVRYRIGYSARNSSLGEEVMFFSPNLKIPQAAGCMQETSRRSIFVLAEL